MNTNFLPAALIPNHNNGCHGKAPHAQSALLLPNSEDAVLLWLIHELLHGSFAGTKAPWFQLWRHCCSSPSWWSRCPLDFTSHPKRTSSRVSCAARRQALKGLLGEVRKKEAHCSLMCTPRTKLPTGDRRCCPLFGLMAILIGEGYKKIAEELILFKMFFYLFLGEICTSRSYNYYYYCFIFSTSSLLWDDYNLLQVTYTMNRANLLRNIIHTVLFLTIFIVMKLFLFKYLKKQNYNQPRNYLYTNLKAPISDPVD